MVRIYRRGEDNPEMVVGTVQKVGDERKEIFSSLPDLCSILNPLKQELPQCLQGGEESSARTSQKKKMRTSKRRPNGRD